MGGDPKRIVFVEVKTGKTLRLTPLEKKIKKIIDEKKVTYDLVKMSD